METTMVTDYEVAVDFQLATLPEQQTVINTLNAHSWVVADKDAAFKQALLNSDVIIPDGVGVVWAARYLNNVKVKKVAGADLHDMSLKLLEARQGRCFYLGSSTQTLEKIESRISTEYPHIHVATYSPPFKSNFSKEDNDEMVRLINEFKPDVLFVGMTAPKQEKWVEEYKNSIHAHLICSIGAVFNFYAGDIKRAPQIWIDCGLEWLYRALQSPMRLGIGRYLKSNPLFVFSIIRSKMMNAGKFNIQP